MTQHKVIAEDSLSAMDEISKVLGKDAVILNTQKVNGKIEILGSNNIEDIASSNVNKIKKQNNNFSHLFSNHNLDRDTQNRKLNSIIENKKVPIDFNLEKIADCTNNDNNKTFVDVETFNKFSNKIENLLKDMVISDINEFSTHKNKSLTIELLKKGFSKKIVSDFQEKIINDQDIKETELFFYHERGKRIVFAF
jgi:flagellar biosynthesis GTPase FlhF